MYSLSTFLEELFILSFSSIWASRSFRTSVSSSALYREKQYLLQKSGLKQAAFVKPGSSWHVTLWLGPFGNTADSWLFQWLPCVFPLDIWPLLCQSVFFSPPRPVLVYSWPPASSAFDPSIKNSKSHTHLYMCLSPIKQILFLDCWKKNHSVWRKPKHTKGNVQTPYMKTTN